MTCVTMNERPRHGISVARIYPASLQHPRRFGVSRRFQQVDFSDPASESSVGLFCGVKRTFPD
jgi:hypothetical protein